MPKLSEIIAEIETDLSNYVDDIDRNSIKRNCVLQLKRFGNNILGIQEATVDIDNSQGTLPENFQALKMAINLDPFGMVVDETVSEDDLRGSFIYKRRLETDGYYNPINHEYVAGCSTKLVEEVITLSTGNAKVYYQPSWLTLTPGINRTAVAKDCLNLNKALRGQNLNEISINNFTVNANFSKGKIYIQYYGLDSEDGEIYIPDGIHGNLENYLVSYNKYKIAENIIANNKNPQALSSLLPLWKQDSNDYFRLALTESKFMALGDNWAKKMKAKNRATFAQYNLPRF